MRQAIVVSLHMLAGLVASILAFYYLLSDALSFGSELGFSGDRPRITVFAIFAVAAFCLLSGIRRIDLTAQKVLGYAFLFLGLATVWLIFEGSSISA